MGKNPTNAVRELPNRDKSITVTGFVEDVRPYMEKSAVFIVPLRIGSGTRLKILEALAMSKAIVSTSIGCEGIELNDSEHILIADEPEKFAVKVVEFLEDKAKRVAFGKSGRRLVERQYSWDIIGRLINEKIDRLMIKKRPETNKERK